VGQGILFLQFGLRAVSGVESASSNPAAMQTSLTVGRAYFPRLLSGIISQTPESTSPNSSLHVQAF
jgi:hypothetical protein